MTREDLRGHTSGGLSVFVPRLTRLVLAGAAGGQGQAGPAEHCAACAIPRAGTLADRGRAEGRGLLPGDRHTGEPAGKQDTGGAVDMSTTRVECGDAQAE
jgi:hypothetical protein